MSYIRNYALNPNQDEPPLSAREGKTMKEHIELLHMVVAHNTETVDKLSKKVKMLEKALETDADSENDSEKGDKEEKDEKEKINRFSSLFIRVSAAAAMVAGIGLYAVTALVSKKSDKK